MTRAALFRDVSIPFQSTGSEKTRPKRALRTLHRKPAVRLTRAGSARKLALNRLSNERGECFGSVDGGEDGIRTHGTVLSRTTV